MLLRDRNHPSVCFWSIGNELSEQGGLEHGYETSSALAAFVREHDTTRPVCGALCSFFKGLNDEDTAMFWKTFAEEVAASGGSFVNMDNSFGKKIWPEYTAPFVKDWDVVGYNYLSYHYESSHEMFPERVICATESKPGEFEEYWGYVEKLPYLIGDFLWTSWDYIGEAGIGKSIYTTPEQARAAEKEGADYLGSGAWFPTQTKEDAVPITEERYRQILDAVKIPNLAVGGITAENCGKPLECGCDGLAVSGGIMKAGDIPGAIRGFRRKMG
jgi:hypothetical protein